MENYEEPVFCWDCVHLVNPEFSDMRRCAYPESKIAPKTWLRPAMIMFIHPHPYPEEQNKNNDCKDYKKKSEQKVKQNVYITFFEKVEKILVKYFCGIAGIGTCVL